MMIGLLTLIGRLRSMVANTIRIHIVLCFIASNVLAGHFQYQYLAINHLPVKSFLEITIVFNFNIYNLGNCRSRRASSYVDSLEHPPFQESFHAGSSCHYDITSSNVDVSVSLYFIRFFYSFVYCWHRRVLNCLVLNLS